MKSCLYKISDDDYNRITNKLEVEGKKKTERNICRAYEESLAARTHQLYKLKKFKWD